MNTKTFSQSGKYFFWVSFIIGNICLFGYLLTNNSQFAVAGYLSLIGLGIVNLLAVLFFLILILLKRETLHDCRKSIGIILINIPIAFLYAWIGLSLV